MKPYPIFLAIVLLSAACTRNAYYQSPFHTNNHPYRTMPLQADSAKSAIYASGGFSVGGANVNSKDKTTMFHGSVYKAHNLRYFKAYYGLTGTLGSYNVTPYEPDVRPYRFDTTYINANAGKKSVRGVGLIAGASFVIPFNTGAELRLGMEGSVQREFGKYFAFRKRMPDSSANIVNRYQTDGSFGINLDLIGRSRYDGSQFGWKLSHVITLNRQYVYPVDLQNNYFRSSFFSNTFHYTREELTGFIQFNLGSFASNFQTGVNYRFGN